MADMEENCGYKDYCPNSWTSRVSSAIMDVIIVIGVHSRRKEPQTIKKTSMNPKSVNEA